MILVVFLNVCVSRKRMEVSLDIKTKAVISPAKTASVGLSDEKVDMWCRLSLICWSAMFAYILSELQREIIAYLETSELVKRYIGNSARKATRISVPEVS